LGYYKWPLNYNLGYYKWPLNYNLGYYKWPLNYNLDEVQVLNNVKLGCCILIMNLDNAQCNIITESAKFANSYRAWVRGGLCLEVTKLPYNESYDTFNNISLFTGNSFKQN
jgi:hypothetical protein